MEKLNLKVTLNKNGSITASWSRITGAVRYHAHIYPIGKDYVVYNKDNLTVTSCTTESNLKANQQYRVSVAAYSSNVLIVSEGFTQLISYDFYNQEPLAVPQNITAEPSTISVKIGFDKVERASNYDVQFDNSVYNVTGSGTRISKTISGLKPKTSHTYAVRAKNANKTGAYSTKKTVMTLAQSPAVPVGVKKTVTETTATISWNASNLATSYEIVFNGSTYNVTGTSRSFTGLSAGTGYKFKIRAKNADGASSYTSELTVTTAPKAPTNVRVECTDKIITIRWDKSEGATLYYVKFNGQEVLNLPGSTVYEAKGLQPNTMYTYQVCAASADGKGSYSALQTIKTFQYGLATPSSVTRSSTEDSVTVNWGAVSGATSYDVLFNDKLYNVTGTSKTFIGLQPNSAYTYQVRARMANGAGTYTSAQTVTTAPNAPTGVIVTANESSVTVVWDAVPGAKGYEVLFNGTLYSVSSTTTSRTFIGLNANTGCTVQIRVKGVDGSSTYTAKNTIKTSPSKPSAPKTEVTKNSITIGWDAVPGATSYDILFNGQTYRVTGTSKTFTGLNAGQSYSYAVKSNHEDGSSEYTETKMVTTLIDANVLAPPQNVAATATSYSVTVGWNAVPGAINYDILFNGQTYRTTETSKTFTNLNERRSYSYAVRSNYANGSSEYSERKTITTLGSVTNIATPQIISITATSNSVTITWKAAWGATEYDVWLDSKKYRTTDTSITIDGLDSSTTYNCRIYGTNAGGSGPSSEVKQITTKGGPPEVPKNVTAIPGRESVTITWDKVRSATSYDVVCGNMTFRDITTQSEAITGLKSGITYNYQVRAKNSYGISAYSVNQTVQTLMVAPENVTATATYDSVTVSWRAVTGATGYEILLNNQTHAVTGTSGTIRGLSPETNYTYKVRATSASGIGSYCTAKTIRTLTGPPDVPINLRYTATSSAITVSWNPVSRAISYDVIFNGVTHNVTSNYAKITELRADTTYSWQVRSKNTIGASAYTAVASAKTLIAPPAPPNILKATATTNSVTIQWSSVATAIDYDLLFNGKVYHTTGTSITITELRPGISYDYAVRASNEGGIGAYSVTRSIQTTPVPPTVPTDVIAIATANTVDVLWIAVDGGTSYDVLFNGRVYSVSGTSKTIEGLMPNTDYSYAVRARNAAGTSAYSETKTVKTLLSIPTGIKAEADITSISLSWEPVAGAVCYDIDFNGAMYEATDTLKEFMGLEPKTEYTFAIQARNEAVSSGFSRKETVSTKKTVPDAPQNVSAVATMNCVIVSWDAMEDVQSYEVEFDGVFTPVTGDIVQVQPFARSRVRSMAGVMRNAAALADSNAIMDREDTERVFQVFAGLKANSQHSYMVRAYNESGAGEFSALRMITTGIYQQNGLPWTGQHKNYPDGKLPHMGLDPVNALTGAFLWSYTFCETEGKDVLHFTVMYDSQRDEQTKVLGKGWTYSLYYQLYMDEEYAYFSVPHGVVIPFRKEADGRFQSVEGIQPGVTLERNEDGTYAVKTSDNTEYLFDAQLHLSAIRENGADTYCFHTDADGQIIGIEGKYGKTLSLSYENGRIKSVTDVTGNAVHFAYDNGCLASAEIAGVGSMSFTYDGVGRLIRISDFAENTYLTNQYDLYGRVVVQDIAGRGTSQASYDETNRVTVFTDALGGQTKYYYDEKLHITRIEQGENGISSSYNDAGQLTESTDAFGHTTQMFYDEKGRMVQVIHPDGTEEQGEYNDNNSPVKVVNRDGTETIYGYDERNNLTFIQDERGNVCTYDYDERDNLISYADREGNIWHYVYDEDNHLESAVDPKGMRYLYSHDKAGRMTSYTSPAQRTVTYQYAASGELLSITDADGSVLFEYDSNGSRVGTTDRMGSKQRLEYNEMGQVSLITDFMGKEYRFAYDGRGNLIRETDPLGYSVGYTYDEAGNRISMTDQRGFATGYGYDAMNRLTEVRDAAGGTVRYSYDAMGQISTTVDPLGHQTKYAYDDMGRLLTVTDALNHNVSYTYDQAGNLLTETDADGAVTAYAYDKENRLLSITTDAGVTRFTYDVLGRVIAVVDTEAQEQQTEYDGDGLIKALTDQEGRQTAYAYDESGRLSEVMAPDGGKTAYVYDKNGNCTQVTDAEENVYVYAYDANNRLVKETDPLGQETIYTYDDRGMLTLITDANGGESAFTYDGSGNLIMETNPLGGQRTYVYDSLGRLAEVMDEEGHTTTFAYDEAGNMVSYTDANGKQWTYAYDVLHRLISVMDEEESRLAYEYTNTGRISKVTDQEGAETSYRYDTMGRLLEMKDALGHSLSFTYDSIGRILTQTDANGNTTAYAYSPAGHLISVTAPEGEETTYTYDQAGRVLTETDGLGNVTAYAYDLLGQVTAVTDAMGGKTSFTYTAAGQVETVTDAEGGVTSYGYDACGNLIRVTDPEGSVTEFEYDAMNNQVKECLSADGEQCHITLYQYDRRGQKIREINPALEEKSYTYDGNGNLISATEEDGSKTVVRYDLNNRPVHIGYSDGKEAAFRYNKRGELVEMTDWNGTALMERDRLGRLSKITDPEGRSVGYSYDGVGNLIKIVYPDGSMVYYGYDRNSRLVSVTDGEEKAADYGYDGAGRLNAIRRPGSQADYALNGKGLPIQASYLLEDGLRLEETFQYDALGRITGTERKGTNPVLAGKTAYSYSRAGRLTSWQEGGRSENYVYDRMGNRTEKWVNNALTASYTYDDMNRLVSMSEGGVQYGYGYDRRGNLTEERRDGILTRRYGYDARGRMVFGRNLENGSETAYHYNALLSRVGQTQTLAEKGGLTTRETSYVLDYLSGTDNELMAYEGNMAVRTLFGHGYERIGQKVMLQGGAQAWTPREMIAGKAIGTAYFQPDLYGSPLLVSDAGGNALRYLARNPWGDPVLPTEGDRNLSGLEGNLRFTTYSYEKVIGKWFGQARFYDSGQGRMLAADPVKRGLNGYPYCGSDPVNYVDPTGEVANILGGGVIGGLVGGAFGFAGSAVSQLVSGEGFSLRKAAGAGVNGLVTGAVKGALVGSGVGIPLALASDFAAGAVGNALEQTIVNGKVDVRESITSGLTNAVSGAIYGNKPIKSVWGAIGRGAGAGAATAAINNISEAIGLRNRDTGYHTEGSSIGGRGIGWLEPYEQSRDPRIACSEPIPLESRIGYRTVYGYQYGERQGGGRSRGTQKQSGFRLGDFLKDVAVGAVTGGLASAAFYGAGKAVQALKDSVRANKSGTDTQTINNKFPNDNQAGRTFNFTVEDGKINIENGIQEVDFVMDMDGNLHIGRGHSYLANGNSVQAAGTMKVNTQGYIRLITNESGHYQPTVTQAMNYPDIFRSAGLIVDNAWIRMSDFSTSMSNYVINTDIFYNGPVQYMPR